MTKPSLSSKQTFRISSWLFIKCIGVVYLIAFVSFWVQMPGLIGSKGILPAVDFISWVAERVGPQRFWLLPTWGWISTSDDFLHLMCGIGVFCSLMLLLGFFPLLMLFFLWTIYLSLVNLGQDFMSFQWDVLLLEAGFMAMFLVPLGWFHGRPSESNPTRIALVLGQWLIFRLMFLSGFVKLASGDSTWRHLTALLFHYETQPLPTWVGWQVAHWPVWFHQLSCAGVFLIELIVPFFVFGSQWLKRSAFFIFLVFQTLIALTGNYCFFNFLTIALGLFLVDDELWLYLRQKFQREPGETFFVSRTELKRFWPTFAIVPFASLILMISTLQLLYFLPWPQVIRKIDQKLAPFHIVNHYGLFAVMTTVRNEIVLEGSRDGIHWEEYDFIWKPGDTKKIPAFVAPHQPRLDWQMWFAALGNYRENVWLTNFMVRLMQGNPAMKAFFKRNPFPEDAPDYMRASVWEYQFASEAQKKSTGQWWNRKRKALYAPILKKEGNRIIVMRDHDEFSEGSDRVTNLL